MTDRLKIAVEELYSAFSKYPASNMEGSPLYEDLDKWNHNLLTKDLRKLTEDDLSRFTGSVLLTWGDEKDFKHFLPRIFELIAELRPPDDIWLTFEKLDLAKWKNWQEGEQKAIKEFMLALWHNLLNDGSERAEWNFKDYFSTIANFYPEFDDLINIWTVNKSKYSIKHLAEFVFNQRENLFDKGFIPGFYNKTENIEKLKSWLLSSNIRDRLGQAFFEFEKEEIAGKISWAEKILSDEKSTAHNNTYTKSGR